MCRIRSLGWVLVLVGGAGISALGQQPGDAQKEELQKMRNRVRQIDGQIGSMASFYARDTAIVELDKAKNQAAAAVEAEIEKRIKADEKGAALMTEKPVVDQKIREMETQWRAIEAKINGTEEVVAAKKQADEARRLADDEAKKVTALIAQKFEGDAEAVKLRADMDNARRDRDRAGREIAALRSRMVLPQAIIAAEQEAAKAQDSFTKAVDAAVQAAMAADEDGKKVASTMADLMPMRKELETKVKAAKEKAEKSNEAVTLKKAQDDASKASDEKRQVLDKLFQGKLAADAEAPKLAADLKTAATAEARQEIEGKLKEIREKINESEDVKAAKTAYDEAAAARDTARKAYQEKLAALFAEDAAATEADGRLRELVQAEGQMQKIRKGVEQGDAVKAERDALAAARAKLAEARASVDEKAKAAVTATEDGAKLVKEKAELEAKIGALAPPAP